MFVANLDEYLFCRSGAAMGNVVQTLTDASLSIGASGNVEQTLIGLGVLPAERSLAIGCPW